MNIGAGAGANAGWRRGAPSRRAVHRGRTVVPSSSAAVGRRRSADGVVGRGDVPPWRGPGPAPESRPATQPDRRRATRRPAGRRARRQPPHPVDAGALRTDGCSDRAHRILALARAVVGRTTSRPTDTRPRRRADRPPPRPRQGSADRRPSDGRAGSLRDAIRGRTAPTHPHRHRAHRRRQPRAPARRQDAMRSPPDARTPTPPADARRLARPGVAQAPRRATCRGGPPRHRDAAWGPWGSVSEVMLQQTPVVRVEPVWRQWMSRLAHARRTSPRARPPTSLRAWGRLGYPRRALRLQECARAVTEHHGGVLPPTSRPAHPARHRLVHRGGGRRVRPRRGARSCSTPTSGASWPARSTAIALPRTGPDRRRGAPRDRARPARRRHGRRVGGRVHGARRAGLHRPRPALRRVPGRGRCARWRAAGNPPTRTPPGAARRRWTGTDRQVRGRVMAPPAGRPGPVPPTAVEDVWPDAPSSSGAWTPSSPTASSAAPGRERRRPVPAAVEGSTCSIAAC